MRWLQLIPHRALRQEVIMRAHTDLLMGAAFGDAYNARSDKAVGLLEGLEKRRAPLFRKMPLVHLLSQRNGA